MVIYHIILYFRVLIEFTEKYFWSTKSRLKYKHYPFDKSTEVKTFSNFMNFQILCFKSY